MERTFSWKLGLLVSAVFALLPPTVGAAVPLEEEIVLESAGWLRNEKSSAASSFGKRDNLRALHRKLSEILRVRVPGHTSARALTLNSDRLSEAQLRNAIGSIASGIAGSALESIRGRAELEPKGGGSLTRPNESCEEELGHENGLDMQYTFQRRWAPGSLVGNVDFPLRRNLSCIRNQGSRGTCTAFASTAALEVLVHQETDRFTNLSEQHLYFWGYVNVDPDDSEGLPTEKTVNALVSEGYRAVLESGWQYNPSSHRSDRSENGELDGSFQDVCVGYTEATRSVPSLGGESCSETIHQGLETVIRKTVSAGGSDYTLTYKDYDAPATAVPTSVGLRSSVQIWNEASPESSLQIAKVLLEAGVPLVSGGGVTDSFKHNGAKGFIPYIQNEENVGGHAMLMVAWVPNSELPSGAPEGSGGGYFIFRNSWGMSVPNSDRGYYYAPYNYVKEHTAGLTAAILR